MIIKKDQGFTAIEILIVISILIILLAITIGSYLFFERRSELDDATHRILEIIRSAQNKTLASKDDTQYGVYFQNDRITIFKGDSYSATSTDNEIFTLPDRLEIYDTSLRGGGNELVFEKLSGRTEQYGSTTIRMIDQPSQATTIFIASSGQLNTSQPSACCQSNRITDTRHLHFDLGWSIQNSATTTLIFSDSPTITETINMADYFDPTKTEFDWKKTIDVNGENQTLRIHTHSLDAFNTILCVHRDRMRNDKPVQIEIDGKSIVSYDADGAISVEAYGGTVEKQ